MRQLFRDRIAAETGMLGRSRLWMDLLKDFAVSVRREHRRRREVAATASGGYRISEEGIAEMQRAHIWHLPIVFLAIAAGLLIAWLGHAPRWPLFAVYGFQTFFAMALLRSLGRHQDHWLGYELILNEDRIQQSQRGVITLTLG
jgi:hypothetical protein